MSVVTLFKNTNGSTCVVLATLEKVNFPGGKFFTDDEVLARKLEHCAKTREFGIYIDPKEPTVDTQYKNPVDALRAKMKAESEGELRAMMLKAANSPEAINAGISPQNLQAFLASIDSTRSNELTGKPLDAAEKVTQAAQQKELGQAATQQSLVDKLKATK